MTTCVSLRTIKFKTLVKVNFMREAVRKASSKRTNKSEWNCFVYYCDPITKDYDPTFFVFR